MTFAQTRRAACVVAAAALAWGPISRALADTLPEQAGLSERLIEVANQLSQVSPSAADAIADAAERMMPADPRLLRAAIDLRLSLGQRDPAIKLLGQLRQLTPTDQLALIQSIDLLSNQIETAELKADYLQKMVANPNLAAEVRAHAAVLLAVVQDQRGLDGEAAKAMTVALRLNPLNPRALQWNVDVQMRSASAPQRAHALVDALLANPLQPAVMSRLSEELVRAGDSDTALNLYGHEFDELNVLDVPASPDDAINYAALLQRAGKSKEAANITGLLLKDDPYNSLAHFMDILLAQQAGDATSQISDARNATIKAMMKLRQQINPQAPSPDGTASPALPDLKSVIDELKKANQPKITALYLQYLADLAWIDLYFAGQPAQPAVVDAIHTIADPKSDLVARIDGYSALVAGQPDAAKEKLSAAGHDLLSQLGLLSLRLKQGQDKAAVLADGNALLQQYPTGVWAMMIRQTVKPAGDVDFKTSDLDAVVAESKRLPERWLDFANKASENYLVKVESPSGKVAIGDPVLAQVTMQNVSDRPLLIGPGGVINQYVPIDVTVRGIQEQAFPAAAMARLTQTVVLQPGQTVTTTVRLDTAGVAAYLASGPQYLASIFSSAVVNPAVRGGVYVPGLGGQRVQSGTVIERSTISYSQQSTRDAIAAALQSTDAVVRLRTVLQLAAAISQLQSSSGGDTTLADSATAVMQKTADTDASPTVRAVARQQIAVQAHGDAQAKALQAMLTSPDFESKLLGCLLTINRIPADRQTLLQPLTKDADPVLKQLSTALLRLPDSQATSQPATGPQ